MLAPQSATLTSGGKQDLSNRSLISICPLPVNIFALRLFESTPVSFFIRWFLIRRPGSSNYGKSGMETHSVDIDEGLGSRYAYIKSPTDSGSQADNALFPPIHNEL